MKEEELSKIYIEKWVTFVERDNQTDNERPVALSLAPIPMRGRINHAERPDSSRPMAANIRLTSNKTRIRK